LAYIDRQHQVAQYVELLKEIDANVIKLPGLTSDEHLECLAKQLWDSFRRIEFVHHIRDAKHDPRRADPTSSLFDPLKAAVIQARAGNIDEAYWLIFLAVHFGKHGSKGWELARKIYGKLGGPGRWDWAAIKNEGGNFRPWLAQNLDALSTERFSNHRKYESLRPESKDGTAAVFESYANWVRPYGTHQDMIRSIHKSKGQNPTVVFDELYRSMDSVKRFGRLGRFDFLTMLGKLGIAPIAPGSAYLWHNATGPKKGARLLFGGDRHAPIAVRQLDEALMQIDQSLQVGMQALEDSLCNWQKSPTEYQYFKG
jgi:hypothetical protein